MGSLVRGCAGSRSGTADRRRRRPAQVLRPLHWRRRRARRLCFGHRIGLGVGAALLDRAHIRIDSLYLLFPTWLRVALDLAGLLLLVGFFSLVAWHGSGVVMQSWTSGSRSQSDLQVATVIPQLIWVGGLALFVFVGLVLLVDALVKLRAGNVGGVTRAIGTRSAEEEVEEEIQALKERQTG